MRPGRAIDDGGVEQIGALVLADHGVDAIGKFPGRHDRFRQLAGRTGVSPFGQSGLGALLHGLDLEPRQCAAGNPRAVDLAVVMPLDQNSGRHRGLGLRQVGDGAAISRDHRRRSLDVSELGAQLLGDGGDLGIERVDHLRFMVQRGLAGRRVKAGGDEMPGVVPHRRAGRDHLVVDAKLDAAIFVEEEAVTLAITPFRHQPLRTVLPVFWVGLRRGRPDPALQRDAFNAELRLVGDKAVRSGIDLLLDALVGSVAIRLDRLFDEAGATRVGIAVDHLDDISLILGRTIAIHEELDRVSGVNAEFVSIAGNLHPTHNRFL